MMEMSVISGVTYILNSKDVWWTFYYLVSQKECVLEQSGFSETEQETQRVEQKEWLLLSTVFLTYSFC